MTRTLPERVHIGTLDVSIRGDPEWYFGCDVDRDGDCGGCGIPNGVVYRVHRPYECGVEPGRRLEKGRGLGSFDRRKRQRVIYSTSS